VRRFVVGLTSLALALAFGGTGLAAAPPVEVESVSAPETAQTDDLPNPLEEKRRELREQALDLVLSGEARPEQRGVSTVVKVGEAPAADGTAASGVEEPPMDDQYVELARETTDRIFVVLAEFGNERDPRFPDRDTDPAIPGPARFDGPLHDEIPEPDRALDNSTVWQPGYSQQYYEDLYFSREPGAESLAQYYERQSSGRYSVEGTVTDWVRVRYNEARYGRSDDDPTDANGDDPAVCGSNVCATTWDLVNDAVDQWVANQKAAGRTAAQIVAELRTFDRWDRYDFDADGNFNESDGYIDHFQIVHAGGDQADGDPAQGEDAIWSHRWYVAQGDSGRTGPAYNLRGGAEIGDTGLWAGDYTIQPENGGRSVFTHEYGHDLGLPDLYDTASGGGDQVAWWSLMGQSRLSGAQDQGIGTRSGDLGAWEKLQLGWLDHEVALPGQDRRYVLGPHEYNTANPQALVVMLPDKEVTTDLGAPYAGARQWWSDAGDDVEHTMTRTLDLETATATASLSLKARYDTEEGYDHVYAQVSADGGATWTSVDGTVDGEAFGTGAGGTPALDGESGGPVDMVVPLDAYVGQTVDFRFLYRTDGAVAERGFFADEIVLTVDGEPVFRDGAEQGANGWVLDGVRAVGASETQAYAHYYIASNRQYVSYDQYLRTGPYHFGFLPDRPDLVEHFGYQNGLLVSYWDTSFDDNNTSVHPGAGLVLPIDSHPQLMNRPDGAPWRGRVQIYDAPFTRELADSFTLHHNGQPGSILGQRGVSTFDDTQRYWYPELPTVGVVTPGVGVGIRILREQGTTMTVRVFPTGT